LDPFKRSAFILN